MPWPTSTIRYFQNFDSNIGNCGITSFHFENDNCLHSVQISRQILKSENILLNHCTCVKIERSKAKTRMYTMVNFTNMITCDVTRPYRYYAKSKVHVPKPNVFFARVFDVYFAPHCLHINYISMHVPKTKHRIVESVLQKSFFYRIFRLILLCKRL